MAAMDAMESELDRKSEYIRQLSAHVNLLEKQLEEKTLDNLAMRSLLQSYEQQGNNDHKNSKHSKLVGMDSVISTEEANYDLNTKIESYLNGLAKGQQCSNGLVLSTINSFMTLYHLNYSKRDINEDLVHEFFTNRTISRTTNSDNINELLTISLTYALLFLTQLQNRRLTDSLANKVTVESYPMHWLISMFPYVLSSDGNSDDNSEIKIDSWLPIHLAIGVDIDGSMLSRNKERYMDNLDRLLIEFGASAFTDEDVSPLSIAVAKQRPSIDVVKKLVSYCNDKLSIDIIRKTDFDGSLPLMHACANNKNTVIVDFLLSKYSQGLLILDNYGCSALHYACYSGYEAVVSYILMKSPESAHIVDSNGALPLHDAVQNITDKIRRTHNRSNSDSNTNTNNDSYSDYEDNEDIDNLDNSDTRKSASGDGNWNELSIVKMLLSANPQAVFHKDSFGAYPLHKAAKAASLNVVKLIYDAFPQVINA